MTGAEAIEQYRKEHADELDRIAELKLKQAIELQLEAVDLQYRATQLRIGLERKGG